MLFESEVRTMLEKAGAKEIKLEVPPDPKMGDLAFACFKLGGNPVEKAREIAKKIKPSGMIGKVIAVGPYVNFFVEFEKFSDIVLKDALKKNFGGNFVKGTALIEHTSINPNASPHVGRARNAIIADSVVRILRFAGYKVDVHYFVNDIGKQIAMLVYATKELKGKPRFDEMLKHYIEINRRVLENVTLEKDVLNLLYRLEKGDKKIRKMFEDVVSTCIKGQTGILGELNIKYDSFDYESKYIGSKILKDVLKKLKPKTKKDFEGRLVLDLSDFNLPMKEPFVPLTRNDGTSLYFLRDIAYNVDKIKWSKGGKNIVALGEDHKLEFMQIKSALSLLKLPAPEVIHYTFILLPEGKMSTRSGNIVLLTDFMKEAVDKAREEITKRNPEIKGETLERTANAIGYSAIKYAFLKVGPEKNIIFSWEDALNFEGNSAPYLQYTAVRAKKILERVKAAKPKNLKFEDAFEIKLVKKISDFTAVIKECAEQYKPHMLANYTFELATSFNEFYEKCSVMNETDIDKKGSRILLVKAYLNVMSNCLNLLGLWIPDFM
jgi:arginyl-tRNA synthetase